MKLLDSTRSISDLKMSNDFEMDIERHHRFRDRDNFSSEDEHDNFELNNMRNSIKYESIECTEEFTLPYQDDSLTSGSSSNISNERWPRIDHVYHDEGDIDISYDVKPNVEEKSEILGLDWDMKESEEEFDCASTTTSVSSSSLSNEQFSTSGNKILAKTNTFEGEKIRLSFKSMNKRTYAKRKSYSDEQTNALEEYFKKSPKLSALDILDLQCQTKLTQVQIRRWFKAQLEKLDKEKICTRNSVPISSRKQHAINTYIQTNTEKETCISKPIESCISINHLQKHKPIIEKSTEMTQQRLDSIAEFSSDIFKKKIEHCVQEIKCLIKMYLNSKMGLRETLVFEAQKIKEISGKFFLYTNRQEYEMQEWRTEFFEQIMKNKKQPPKNRDIYNFIENEIIAVWHPLIMYSKLAGLSLNSALRDFIFKSTNWESSSSSEFNIPSVLKHFSKSN